MSLDTSLHIQYSSAKNEIHIFKLSSGPSKMSSKALPLPVFISQLESLKPHQTDSCSFLWGHYSFTWMSQATTPSNEKPK